MIGVVDYEAGNLYNVGRALKHLGARFVVSGDAEVIAGCDKVILPGVGSARTAMNSLARQGLVDVIKHLNVPFLGICLGLQLLFERSEEDDCPCLGLLPGSIRRFDSKHMKVPHMGWNQVAWIRDERNETPALALGVPEGTFFYFVHGYYASVDSAFTIGWSDYGGRFSAAVKRGNFLGVQFHPERSGESGLQLLSNFIEQ